VNAIIHGKPVNGRRMPDSRASSVNVYGVSAYANAATVMGSVDHRKVRSRNQTPAPAKNSNDPSQSRCATHIGRPTFSVSQ
jgi:hypothetical protein